jgi:hypothetical protein
VKTVKFHDPRFKNPNGECMCLGCDENATHTVIRVYPDATMNLGYWCKEHAIDAKRNWERVRKSGTFRLEEVS